MIELALDFMSLEVVVVIDNKRIKFFYTLSEVFS